jgi:hypothetical protein
MVMVAATWSANGIALAADLPATAHSAVQSIEWLHDMPTAQQRAAETGRPILVDFTSSDRCVWCNRLSQEVFSQPEFQVWARDHVVLVQLDFPADDANQLAEQRQHNEEWLKRMRVQGFPTVMLLDEQARPFARTGYREGGLDKYIQHLEQLLQVRLLRDTSLGLAETSAGADRARFLDEALSTMDAHLVALHYSETIQRIQELGDERLRGKYTTLLESTAGGAEAAGIAREAWMSDPFGFLGADMQASSQYLQAVETEPPVTQYHPRIEERLAKLIELMDKT